jgi:hypothetical protein
VATLTPEQRRLVEKAGSDPVRLEDPDTHTSYVLVREEAYRRLEEAVAIEKVDPSLFEYGEFRPRKS